MKIAIEGCMHGDLDNVYRTIQHHEQIHNTKVDLLLCCGDFQVNHKFSGKTKISHSILLLNFVFGGKNLGCQK